MFVSRHAPLVLSPEVQQVLATAYSEPHRAYHDHSHIAELLRWFDWVADETGWEHPVDVYLALVFHDAVYDPLAKDNEERSAVLARSHGASERTAELIRLTARHGSLAPTDVDHDAALFLDCDAAILGAPEVAFDAYDAAIATEYAAVPPDAFRAGRKQFLATMLARPRIYLSDLFHTRLDALARANLKRALADY